MQEAKTTNIVKQVCQELGINQAELARRMGVSPSNLSEWSSGKRKTPKYATVILNLFIENMELKKDSEILEKLSQRLIKRENRF